MERSFLKKRALVTCVLLLSFVLGFFTVSVLDRREVQAAGSVSVRVLEDYNFPDGATVYFDLSGFANGDVVSFTFTMPFEADSFSSWNMDVTGGPTVFQITIAGWGGNPNNNGSNVYGIYIGKNDACDDLLNGGCYVSGVTVSNPNATTAPPPPPPPTNPPGPAPTTPTTPTTPTARPTTATTTTAAPTTTTTRQTSATTAAPTAATTAKPSDEGDSAPVATTAAPAAGGEQTSPAQPDATTTAVATDVTTSDTSETSEESTEETSEETSEETMVALDIPTSPSADMAGEVEETSETRAPTPTPLPRLYDAGIHKRHFPWWLLIIGILTVICVLRYRKLAAQDMYMDEIICEFIPGGVIGKVVGKFRPNKDTNTTPVTEEEKPKVVNGYLQTSNTRVIRPEYSNVAALNKAKELEKDKKLNGELPGLKPPVKRPKSSSVDRAATLAAGSTDKSVDLSKDDGQNSVGQDDIISSEEVNEQGDI